MNYKNLICGVAMLVASYSYGITLQNGNISIEVNGDGKMGALVYKGLSHLNDSSLRLRHSSSIYETEHIASTEKSYNQFQMMTGYGRETDSNMYVVTCSRIIGTNNCVDQTAVIVSRNANDLGMTYYCDANVQQTPELDQSTHNTANKTIIQSEGDVFIGFKVERNNSPPSSYMMDFITTVRNNLGESVLPNTILLTSLDQAGALAWDNVNVGSGEVVMKTRLMASNSDFGIQTQGNLSAEPVYTLGSTKVLIKKAHFKQIFNKLNKDVLKIKAEIDMRDYTTEARNMSGLDLSIYIGDYLAFQAGDGSEYKVTETIRKHKKKTLRGKHSVTLNNKKGILKMNLLIAKADIEGATLLSPNSPTGVAQPMLLPMTIILTGNNPNDEAKAGKVWIITKSIKVYMEKKNTKSAKAKS